jgi:hypothetical protein
MAVGEFAFYATHPLVESTNSDKFRKIRHSSPLLALANAVAHIMRISQNSSAFGYMRCAIRRAHEIVLTHCVSAADQMQFFTDAPLSPNMRTQISNAVWRPA